MPVLRRIVVTRSHECLTDAFKRRSFKVAGKLLSRSLKVKGMEFDESLHPVPVPGRLAFRAAAQKARGFHYAALKSQGLKPLLKSASARSRAAFAVGGGKPTFSLRVEFKDEDAIERLKRDRAEEVVGVYADLEIRPFQVYCLDAPVGTYRSVRNKLGRRALLKAGLTGKGVRVAVVDTGIDGSIIPVSGGWSPNPGYVPGSTPPDHGTMCAFDVRIAAPQATILDYALLQSQGATWSAFLSDAIAAFADLIRELEEGTGPLVVTNSWGLFDRSSDAPIGSPENYSANPDHPFNQIAGSLVAAGADVCFAAGNCGEDCPDGRCGIGDVGYGASIHGANSHPDVMTVAAVTVDGRRLGYSSQGPGGLADRKPDLTGYSHFRGSGVYEADGGTSAACPVVAGVAAALRQKARIQNIPPPAMKALLQRTSKDINGSGWDYDMGYGVVNAAAAVKRLDLGPAAAAGASGEKLIRAKVAISASPLGGRAPRSGRRRARVAWV